MIPRLKDAIVSLVGNTTAFEITDGVITNWDYSEVQTNVAQPTAEALATELTRLQAVYDNKEYQRTRAAAYPKIAEQLDKLYHDMAADKGDKTGTWFAAVKAVKDATAKPE